MFEQLTFPFAPKIIYRVEKDGYGLYQYASDYEAAGLTGADEPDKRPGPVTDTELLNDRRQKPWRRMRYGFGDIRALKNWLTPKNRRVLDALGYRVIRFEAPDYYASRFQAVFNPATAKPIGKPLKLTTLKEEDA